MQIRNGQNGRRRGRGGGNGGGGPGIGRVPGPRPDMGNRNEVRVRGNAVQLLEKYRQLARDVSQAGDRVTAEYYLQYADHYYRVVNEFRQRQDEQRPQQQNQRQQQRDYYDDGGDDAGYDMPEPIRVSDMTVTHAAPQGMPPAIRASDSESVDEVQAAPDEAIADEQPVSEMASQRRRRGRPRRDTASVSETVDA